MSVPGGSPLEYKLGQQPPVKRVVKNRAPTTTDNKNFREGDEWLNKPLNEWYKLAGITGSVATWIVLGGTDGPIEKFAVSTGPSPVIPDGLRVITLIDGNGVAMTGGLNSITYDMKSPFTGNFTFTGDTTASTSNATTFDTNNATAGVTLTGTTLAADGTDANIDITITPKGTGRIFFPGYTQNSLSYFGAGGQVTELGPLTDGQLIIGATAGVPAAASLTSTGGTITVTPGANTLDIATATNPISPYVVGPVNVAPYQTIQAAINAANAAGFGAVYIQPGTYTEDLTLFTNVDLVGATGSGVVGQVLIDGTHTPPTSGSVTFKDIRFLDATSIISSAAAGTTFLLFSECSFTVTNGYTLDLQNWTGNVSILDCFDLGGTDDGFFNNTTGGTTLRLNGASVGAGTTNPMILNGGGIFQDSLINCPMTVQGTANLGSFGANLFLSTLTFTGASVFQCTNCLFSPVTTAAIVYNSSAVSILVNVTVNTSNAPAIDGTGAGLLLYTGINFTQDSTFASTLTLGDGTLSAGAIKANSISAQSTGANKDITLTPKGTGGLVLPTYTTNAVPYIGTAGLVSEAGPMTNGQLLIGSTGAAPASASLSSTGSTLTITPGAGSINLETGSAVSTSFPCDTGTATPSAGVLNIVGAGNISVTGAGNTVTIDTGFDELIQSIIASSGATFTSSNVILTDNSIPQSSEGDELITLTITPTSATNRLVFNFACFGSSSTNNAVTLALFQDATADALFATAEGFWAAGAVTGCDWGYTMLAGTTNATTFKVRFGPSSASTITLNNAIYGGVQQVIFWCQEIAI